MISKINSSPHIHSKSSTSNIMMLVIICALPGFAVQSYFLGIGTIAQVFLCVSFSYIFEYIFLELRGKDYKHLLADNTAILTGFLLGLAIPAYAPWWISVLGSFFAIVVTKQLYGGVGHNIFNPAMMAYAFLLISFPVQMTFWVEPLSFAADFGGNESLNKIFLEKDYFAKLNDFDVFTSATPLDLSKTAQQIKIEDTSQESSFLVRYAWSIISFFY